MTKLLFTLVLFSVAAFGQTAPLSLVATGDCKQMTVPGNLAITNNSGQTIMALVIRIDAYCFLRHELYVHDFFFKQVAFTANTTIDYHLPTMGSEMKDQPSPPQLPLQATVLYIQFADGTTYGDAAYGQALRSQRPGVISLLQQVQAASTSLAAVQNVLAQPQPSGTTSFSTQQLLKMELEQANGLQAVIKDVNQRLAVAEARQAQM